MRADRVLGGVGLVEADGDVAGAVGRGRHGHRHVVRRRADRAWQVATTASCQQVISKLRYQQVATRAAVRLAPPRRARWMHSRNADANADSMNGSIGIS